MSAETPPSSARGINLVAWGLSFNALWFSVVYLARDHCSALAGALCVLWTLIFISLRPLEQRRALSLWSLSGVTLGYLGDGLALHYELYIAIDPPLLYPTPLWLLGLWMSFSAFAPVGLGWALDRAWLAVVLGAVSGPLSYLAGVRIGAMRFGETMTTALIVTALLWGAALYLASRVIRAQRDARDEMRRD